MDGLNLRLFLWIKQTVMFLYHWLEQEHPFKESQAEHVFKRKKKNKTNQKNLNWSHSCINSCKQQNTIYLFLTNCSERVISRIQLFNNWEILKINPEASCLQLLPIRLYKKTGERKLLPSLAKEQNIYHILTKTKKKLEWSTHFKYNHSSLC